MSRAVVIVRRKTTTPGIGMYAVFGASASRKRMRDGRGLVEYWFHLDDPHDAASSRELALGFARTAGLAITAEIDLTN